MMRNIIVTGSAGLIGSETVRRFGKDGARVLGIDNDMRAEFFGAEASTRKTRDDLIANVRDYEHHDMDIRDATAVMDYSSSIAAQLQPSCTPHRNRHTTGPRAIRKPISL